MRFCSPYAGAPLLGGCGKGSNLSSCLEIEQYGVVLSTFSSLLPRVYARIRPCFFNLLPLCASPLLLPSSSPLVALPAFVLPVLYRPYRGLRMRNAAKRNPPSPGLLLPDRVSKACDRAAGAVLGAFRTRICSMSCRRKFERAQDPRCFLIKSNSVIVPSPSLDL